MCTSAEVFERDIDEFLGIGVFEGEEGVVRRVVGVVVEDLGDGERSVDRRRDKGRGREALGSLDGRQTRHGEVLLLVDVVSEEEEGNSKQVVRVQNQEP